MWRTSGLPSPAFKFKIKLDDAFNYSRNGSCTDFKRQCEGSWNVLSMHVMVTILKTGPNCSFLVLSSIYSPMNSEYRVTNLCLPSIKTPGNIWSRDKSSEAHQASILGWTSVAAACCSVISLPPFSHSLFFYLFSRLRSNVLFFYDPFLKQEFSLLFQQLALTTYHSGLL